MNENVKKLGLWQMTALHLLPGALITAFYFLVAPLMLHSGYPPIAAIYLAILVILLPFELGFLYYQGRQLNGRFSLKGIVLFREHIPTWQVALLAFLLLAWAGLMFTLLPPLDNYLMKTLFDWFPAWTFPANVMGDPTQMSKLALNVIVLAGLLLNGFVGPFVEELYFRGYLLPRIPSSRRWAPVINVVLFSLYHFFTPWQNVTRILALIPLVYVVSWKRNITIGIWTHCLLNIIGMASTLALLFR